MENINIVVVTIFSDFFPDKDILKKNYFRTKLGVIKDFIFQTLSWMFSDFFQGMSLEFSEEFFKDKHRFKDNKRLNTFFFKFVP